MRVRQGPVEKIEKFTQSKRIPRKIMWLQIPPTLFISSLKENLVEKYIAPDPANFLHQLPQKESGGK